MYARVVHKTLMSHVMRKTTFCVCKKKKNAQISFAVTAKPTNTFVFVIRIVYIVTLWGVIFHTLLQVQCLGQYRKYFHTCLEVRKVTPDKW